VGVLIFSSITGRLTEIPPRTRLERNSKSPIA